ncbi:MAG: dTDP-glucose 4,6-dehydratase [Candidatus Yanofskybacteria bacterium]|nr:dTDP-glucose 4,6-dehydratase [Candidatus Yanofskybacteria bacterium]
MKTILVTGGCGFIGSHFIRHFSDKFPDFRIVNLDKLTYSGNQDNLRDLNGNPKFSKKYIFVKGDIADPKKVLSVFKKYRPDYLINFAAETHVDRSIHVSAREFIDTNVCGVFNLLEAAKRYGLKRALFVSTDEVYGSLSIGSKGKFTEKTQYQPNVPYSATKAGGDLLCHAYHFTWKLPVIVTHCSNNYGPYQYPEKLIPFFTLRAIENKPLPLYGDGKNVRDWIFVLDHVEALEKILFKGNVGEIYNIGADNERPNIEIAKAILDILDKPHSLITFVTDRPGHDRRYAIDHTKITHELAWRPRYNFEKMLPNTVGWYLNNPKWVKKVQERTGVINAHIDLWKNV